MRARLCAWMILFWPVTATAQEPEKPPVEKAEVASPKLSVKTGKNEMDNETWVRLELKADQPYESKGGKKISPLVEFQCSVAPKGGSIDVYFYTGIIEHGSDVRIKFNDMGPFYLLYGVLPDQETLQYYDVHEGTNGPLQYIKTPKFMAALAGSKTVLIDFRPFLSASSVVAKFDMTTLLPEVIKHPECWDQLRKVLK